MSQSKLKKALLKRALGFETEEVVEEYAEGEGGEVKLLKRKVTKKSVPPDLTAIKLLTEGEKEVCQMTDEELSFEKQRLLDLIKEKEK